MREEGLGLPAIGAMSPLVLTMQRLSATSGTGNDDQERLQTRTGRGEGCTGPEARPDRLPGQNAPLGIWLRPPSLGSLVPEREGAALRRGPVPLWNLCGAALILSLRKRDKTSLLNPWFNKRFSIKQFSPNAARSVKSAFPDDFQNLRCVQPSSRSRVHRTDTLRAHTP